MSGSPVILLTSAGSLVGQCVLDVLRDRRQNLTIVGANTYLDHDNLRECDVAVELSGTASEGFVESVEDLCRRYDVDLVIPCRDDDVLALAAAAELNSSPINMAGAPAELVAKARDKWASFEWAGDNELSFCPTVCTDTSDAVIALADLVATWGFPLISKPRIGNGSLGVRVILTAEQLAKAASQPGIVIQPYLDPPGAETLNLDLSAGIPLFWEVPVIRGEAVMVVTSRGATHGSYFCFSATHRLGRVEEVARVEDESLTAYAEAALQTLLEAGWIGPVSIPVRRDPAGNWHAIEFNPRFTGGTSARQLLGFDEVRFTLNDWFGWEVVPASTTSATNVLQRTLREWPALRRIPKSPANFDLPF